VCPSGGGRAVRRGRPTTRHPRADGGILSSAMGKKPRRREAKQPKDLLAELRRYDPGSDLAEGFRRASKALEIATRDLVALRHRVTKAPPH